jgi:phosphoglycerate dehydrogenase-like enzyme
MKLFKATNTLDGYLPELDYTADKAAAELILVGGKKFDLSEFPALKAVFKTGVGTDNLPFGPAKERGVEIRLPSEATCDTIYEETAAFACHLILSGLYCDVGDWETWKKQDRRMLARQRLLVLGTGRIGGRVAEKMRSLLDVATFDAATDDAVNLPSLMREADAVTVHIPLNDETRGFMNAERLSWMKDGGLLVNTARGPVVDEDALAGELASGRLRAAFDVFWEEPYRGKLLELPRDRFMVTPHVASTCREFLEGCARDLLAFINELETR